VSADASTDGMPAAADLSIALRAALDLTVVRCGGQGGRIRARVIGQERLTGELARYAPIADDPGVLIALGARADDLGAAVTSTTPALILTVVDGPLARQLRALRAGMAAEMPDLDAATWRSLGYKRFGTAGMQGVGSLAWAGAERILRRAGRPDLADRCKVGMLRTLVTSRLTPALAVVLVRAYRRER
jgi:hypothetical protein